LKHDDWWIKNGGSIGSCGYAASKRSWQAALKHGTRSTDAQQLKAEILLLIQRTKQCACADDMGSVKGLLEQIDAKLSAV